MIVCEFNTIRLLLVLVFLYLSSKKLYIKLHSFMEHCAKDYLIFLLISLQGGEKMNNEKNTEKQIPYEKPQIDAKNLEELSKAFAVKNGMSSC